ncbi:hypothetical protein E2C01_048001 [Portunus trituberculatus]|uniref:Uncharacterized protein n=1 Tax=Portunus trituberculatus TaxID=210409 RepID=A0A5B7GC25_PORTR|nr:hypothetical protein [Portunus trituberculatus]
MGKIKGVRQTGPNQTTNTLHDRFACRPNRPATPHHTCMTSPREPQQVCARRFPPTPQHPPPTITCPLLPPRHL